MKCQMLVKKQNVVVSVDGPKAPEAWVPIGPVFKNQEEAVAWLQANLSNNLLFGPRDHFVMVAVLENISFTSRNVYDAQRQVVLPVEKLPDLSVAPVLNAEPVEPDELTPRTPPTQKKKTDKTKSPFHTEVVADPTQKGS